MVAVADSNLEEDYT